MVTAHLASTFVLVVSASWKDFVAAISLVFKSSQTAVQWTTLSFEWVPSATSMSWRVCKSETSTLSVVISFFIKAVNSWISLLGSSKMDDRFATVFWFKHKIWSQLGNWNFKQMLQSKHTKRKWWFTCFIWKHQTPHPSEPWNLKCLSWIKKGTNWCKSTKHREHKFLYLKVNVKAFFYVILK